MASERRTDTVLVATRERNRSLPDRLRDESTVVEVVAPSALPDRLSDGDPDGVVLAVESPERAADLLAAVDEYAPGTPAAVAPPAGNEALAAVALRHGAAAYASPAVDDDPAETVREAICADDPAEAVDRDPLHRVLANALPDEAFVLDEEGTYLDVKVRPESADLYSVSADDLVGRRLEDAFPADVAADLRDCLDRALETGEVQTVEYETATTDGDRQFEARVVPIDRPIGDRRAVVWLARDVTERVERERSLRRRRDHLETLDRINAVVRRVIETLVEAPTRSAIERNVCEQLVESDLYIGSWIGEAVGDGAVSYRTGAGAAESFLDAVEGLSVDYERPSLRAIRTGTIQTNNRLHRKEPMDERLREAAREHDVRSGLAVPIDHDGTVYGVLAVLASRDDAFGAREREAFRVLGETIGFAINAVKNRRLLFASSVVELELRIDGGDSFSFDLSAEYDCRCLLEWAGTTARGKTYQYITIDGIDGEAVLAEANAHESVDECRLIHDGERRCTVEIRLHESGVRILANHGATIRDVTVEDGVGQLLIEVPRDAEVRSIVEALRGIYERTELVARREVDRPVHTAAERRERILDRLTDRQLTALRLAYYGGYFDWPRGSTGEDVADAMDISPPTMHQHLRKGLRELLSEFFEEGGGTSA
ncbi:bacterio-opsin activator domain-containing protein [Salinilacihabitans rarus]|uniref:bacterio-opsin activator domain-containing protein n=1 Tax=Salinilacihabitans rarus TaxID=2961596 RepID=UPI0020C8B314|nr:bacterio-opsin activator domain-containing protein [Salinilacihabitans rarus]